MRAWRSQGEEITRTRELPEMVHPGGRVVSPVDSEMVRFFTAIRAGSARGFADGCITRCKQLIGRRNLDGGTVH